MGGEALSYDINSNLIKKLRLQTNVFTILCYVNNEPAGLINCVDGFSIFNANPLVNIHDVVVLEEFRGKGLTQAMFSEVEKIALNKGCCKLTLELLEGILIAQGAYKKVGFSGYELDPKMGKAIFWQKKL